MNSKLLLLIPLLFLLNFSIGFAQKLPSFICGFDDLRNPIQAKGIQGFEDALLQQFLKKKGVDASSHESLSGPPYIVPVVVHIIHNGGPENIPDAQILAAIDHLNEGFAAQGYYAQQGATVNTLIQFCMAKRDPEGKVTTGITRTQSSLTNMIMETQDIPTKNLNRWNPLDYVNIWVVNEISSVSLGAGVAGYAFFPNAHGKPNDGMICEAKYFGTSPSEDAVLVHEMGHYFGLYHTFEGGCNNNDCTADGDRVCDTPPDNATHTTCPFNSCSTDVAAGSPFLADVDDFTGDFMDYSPFQCYHFFTANQALRMQASIEAARSSLLDSKGCTSPCTQPIVPAFSTAPNPALPGQTVVFTNNSTGASNYSWSEGGLEFAQTQDASRIFNTVGIHTIVLTASNSDPNCVELTNVFVDIQCPIQAGFSPSQLEAAEGATIDFTNTTTGSGPLTYEWSINGQVVSNATDLSYLFQNSGYYTVLLRAVGTLCQEETSVLIKIANPCGIFPEAVQIAFTSQKKLFQPRDMAALPDGSVIQCGEHFQQPMVTKWDDNGNLLWHKETPINGSCTEIEPTADGHFLMIGVDLANALFAAKIDANGNFLWLKTIQNTDTSFFSPRHFDLIAVNPDGSFGLIYEDEFLDGGYISKLSPDGDIIWTRKIPGIGPLGSLQLATDGSGDFVFIAQPPYNSGKIGFSVLSFSQTGAFKSIYSHSFPNTPALWIKNFDLNVHSDGGYSIFYSEGTNGFSPVQGKYLIRCAANGVIKWAKRYNAIGSDKSFGTYVRQIPNEQGWLVVDSRRDASSVSLGDFLERLDSNGQILWTRHLGDTPVNDVWVMPPASQSGRIRSVHCDFFNQDMHLLSLPDSDVPKPCAPVVPNVENLVAVFPVTIQRDTFPIPKDISTVDLPLVFSDVILTRTDLCNAILPCPEICENELDDDEDGYVDCFDTDCACFDPDTSCLVDPPLNNFSAKLAWQSTVNEASVSSVPIVANLNPQQDSIPEILIIPSSGAISTVNVFKLLIFNGDGSNASNPNTLNFPEALEAYPAVHPTVADLDGNGIPELIIITTDSKIRVFTEYNPAANPCMKLWAVSTQNAWSGNTRAFVADFDGDGISEIFSGNKVFKLDLTNPVAPVLNRVLSGLGARGQLGWSNNSQPAEGTTAADLLSQSDCNGDPDCEGLELAAGYQIYSIDIDLNDGDGYEIKVQRDLNLLDVNHTHTDGYTSVADLDLDGVPEIIVSGRRDNTPGLYVWNKNGLVQNFTHPTFNQVHGMVCVANVFDDRTAGYPQDFPELIACHAPGMLCLNLQKAQVTPAQPFWWTLPTVDASGLTGATVFDFNGDGHAEIVYRDEQNLRIMYGGAAPFPAGVDAQRNWFKTIAGSGTFDEYPVVADVDNDGEAEIAVTSYLFAGNNNPAADYRGRLRIFESANFPWMLARPIWNQYNYFGVNINDDLTVPRVQQKHWLEMGGIGSGKRPFNTHLAQVPSLNPFVSNKIKTPDATVVVDSTHCQTDSFEVFFTICNLGSAILPSGTPIAFYQGDPTISTAPLLFPPLMINEPLDIGACKNIKLNIPATYNTTVFAVINDDGTVPRPYNLAANFPATNQPECHFENNMISFSIQNQTPSLDLGPDISLCKNSVVELTANPNFQRYRWQDGSTSSKITAYTPGKYWVDAFDACGFRQTDTLNIVLNVLSTLDLPEEWSICEGESVHLTSSGFSKYTWSPLDSVSCSDCAAVDVLAKTSITIYLTATEGNCFVTDSVHIRINQNPSVQLLAQDGDCETPASITSQVLGAGPFSFLWSNLSVDSILNVSKSGTYSVEIVDKNGCRTNDSATVAILNSLELSANITEPNCANTSTGSIDLSVSGATQPFQFLWSTGSTIEDLNNLPSGIYTVMTTDVNGCADTISMVLTDPSGIELDLQKTDLSCPGDTGFINLTVIGGIPPFTFSWSNGETTEDLSIAQAGTFTATVMDSNGCEFSESAIISALGAPPVLHLTTDTLSCQNPSVVISAISDVPNTSFSWSGTGGFSSSLPAPEITLNGTFTVTATNPVGGCTAIGVVSVPIDTVAPFVTIPLDSVEMPCGLDFISITAAGSSNGSNFSILWTASGGGSVLSGGNSLSPSIAGSGFYEIMITDLSNGCKRSETIEVVQAKELTAVAKADSVRCYGDMNGAIQIISTSGGILPFLYSIDNQNFKAEPVFENLSAGIYPVYIRDANGCAFLTEIEVHQPAPFSVELIGDTLVIQGAMAHLEATVSPSNFTPAQIEWSATGVELVKNQFEQSVQVFENTIFQIEVSDEHGCSATDSWLLRVDKTHKIYVPNIIYPGVSGGENGTFLIFADLSILEIETLNIFDRWGEQVFANQHFQPNDESQGWNGLFRGKPVQSGVFVWVAKVVFKDGTVEVLSGDLTVVR